MTKNKTYKSDAFAAIHETVSDYYTAGVIDKQTLRRFDKSCLTQVRDARLKKYRHFAQHKYPKTSL